MKISFIIPIYKVELFLAQCIESVVGQTYKDVEIILVDDGSPDRCPMICDEWAKKDRRIIVIHKENQGLGMARNTGLEHATGDFVIFVDSDDFWREMDCLQKIVNVLSDDKTIDLLFFNVVYFDNATGQEQKWLSLPFVSGEKYSANEAFKELVKSGVVPMSAWSKVVKRDVLTKNDILFPSGIYGEDIPWFVILMGKVKSVYFLNEYVYAYRQNITTSITKSNRPKHVHDMKFIIEHVINNLIGDECDQEYRKCVEAFMAYNFSILMSQYKFVDNEDRDELFRFLSQYKYLLKNELHPKVRKVNKLYTIFGLKNTCRILNLYQKYRKV